MQRAATESGIQLNTGPALAFKKKMNLKLGAEVVDEHEPEPNQPE